MVVDYPYEDLMIHANFSLTAFAVSTILMYGCTSISTESESFTPQYYGEWTEAPHKMPTTTAPDGAICGNGDIGMVIGGDAGELKFYLSKNDFWKAQPGYPDGGIAHIGHLSIKANGMQGAAFNMKQHIDDATIRASFKSDDNKRSYGMEAWCDANRNTAVITLRAKEGTIKFDLGLNITDEFGASALTGVKQGIAYSMRKFDSAELEWPSAVAVAIRVLGQVDATTVELKAGEEANIILSFCTNHEQDNYLSGAVGMAKTVDKAQLKAMYADHRSWWKNFWNESEVHIGDPDIEKYYYGSQYLLACCSRNIDFPPGLWGNMLTVDNPAWCGDYHLNYNHMAPWWGAFSSNHTALADPYDTPILEYAHKAEAHSDNMLGKQGVYYPVGIGPRGFCSSKFPLTADDMMRVYGIPDNDIEGGYMFLGQKSNSLFCVANMLMRHYSTYDEKYATKVYPFVRKVADFWEDYLVYENGRYADYNDAFWEVGPWEGKNWKDNFGDINPTQALGMCRMLFEGIIDMASFLDRDNHKIEKWQHILANLSDIPTTETDKGTRILACEGGNGSGSRTAPGFGRVMAHGLVFPSGAFGPARNPEFSKILLDEVRRWNDDITDDAEWHDTGWSNMSNGLETYYTCAARLGYDGDSLLAQLKQRIGKSALPNLWITQAGGGIECFSAVPSCINEMLMQSYEGMIRVFPAWPVQKDASFRDLRAYGAFLVSAACTGGNIGTVTIVSEKGRPCMIENPWKNRACVLTRTDGRKETFTTDTFSFTTQAGETVTLSPA